MKNLILTATVVALVSACGGRKADTGEAVRLLGVARSLHTAGRLAAAIDSARAAVLASPDSSAYYAYLAMLYEENGQPWDAEAVLKHLCDSRPSVDAFYTLATYYDDAGRADDAAAAFERAVKHDPESPMAHLGMSRAWMIRGQADSAVASARRAMELDPNFAEAKMALGEIMISGYPNSDSAAVGVDLIESAIGAGGARTAQFASGGIGIAYALHGLGKDDLSLRLARVSGAALDREQGRFPNERYNLACIFNLVGESDAALSALERAVADGYGDADWMMKDSDLASLHGDRRFEALVKSARGIAGG